MNPVGNPIPSCSLFFFCADVEEPTQLKEEEGQILGCKGGGTALGIFGNLVMHVRNVMNTFNSKCTISTYNLYQITPVFKIFSQLK